MVRLCSVTLVCLLLLVSASAQAATYTASPGGLSIQDCLAQAVAGDTIEIEPGTYPESLAIDVPLTLVGLGGSAATVLDGPDGADVITVSCDGVSISGLHIQGGAKGLSLESEVADFSVDDLVIGETGNYHAQIPLPLVGAVANAVTLVPHSSGARDAIVVFGGSVSQSSSWPALPVPCCYYVPGQNFNIGGPDNPVLTLEPGTVLKFLNSHNRVSQIQVGDGGPGGLIANEVLFTSLYDDSMGGDTSGNDGAPERGQWARIIFRDGAIADSCILTDCEIRYGGGGSHVYGVLASLSGGSFVAERCSITDCVRGVNVAGEGVATVHDCIIESSAYGVYISPGTDGSGITDCTITQSGSFPVGLPMEQVNSVVYGQGNTFNLRDDGVYNAFRIVDSNITESMTLPMLPNDYVYYIDGCRVNIGGPDNPVLTLEPGVVLKLLNAQRRPAQVLVGEGGPGGLIANEVVFTSLYDDSMGGDTSGNGGTPERGQWGRILFRGEAIADSCALTDCDIRYGGDGRYISSVLSGAPGSSFVIDRCSITDCIRGVDISGEGIRTIRDCLIETSGYGIKIHPGTDGSGITDCTITQSGIFPVCLPMEQVNGVVYPELFMNNK